MNGLYLHEQQVHLVVDNRKSLLVRPIKLEKYVDEPLFLLSKNKVFGIIKLDSPKLITLDEFKNTYKEHLINEYQRNKWWPDKTEFYTYKIDFQQIFRPILYWKLIDRPHTFVDNVEIDQFVIIKVPIKNLSRNHFKGVDQNEIDRIIKRIKFISLFIDKKEADISKKILGELQIEKKPINADNFILQMRFDNVNLTDASDSLDVLKQKKYVHQYELRLQKNEVDMVGWIIKSDNLTSQHIPIEEKPTHSAKVWLKVAEQPSYLVDLDNSKKIKYFTMDKGKYIFKKLGDNVFEYTFNGSVMKGQYVCSKRFRTQKWLMEPIKSLLTTN